MHTLRLLMHLYDNVRRGFLSQAKACIHNGIHWEAEGDSEGTAVPQEDFGPLAHDYND